jgi:hypothetical protein
MVLSKLKTVKPTESEPLLVTSIGEVPHCFHSNFDKVKCTRNIEEGLREIENEHDIILYFSNHDDIDPQIDDIVTTQNNVSFELCFLVTVKETLSRPDRDSIRCTSLQSIVEMLVFINLGGTRERM